MLPNISETHTIMLRLPSGTFKLITINADNTVCSLGKFGSFDAKELIGHPYGYTYEIQSDKSLKVLSGEVLKKMEEEVGNNEFIVDDNESNQILSHDEIKALRDSGDREALIEKLKQNNKSFELKTEYSKEKYTARKMAKLAPRFTTIPPTLFDVISFLTDKDAEKILNVNQESMGFLLNTADVRPGCHYLVVDDVSGLLVAGLLELGANITMVHDTEHANVDSVKYFPQFDTEQLFRTGRLKALNWEQVSHKDTVLAELDEYITAKTGTTHPRELEKLQKRHTLKAIIEEFHNTTFDGCLVMSTYTPLSVITPLLPRLGNSRKIAVYSPYREPLLELRHAPLPELLMPCIKELRAREYQVLQGRTRPVMTKRGEWGYVYHAIKVQRLEGVTAVGKNQIAREKHSSATKTAKKRSAITETTERQKVPPRPLVLTMESTDGEVESPQQPFQAKDPDQIEVEARAEKRQKMDYANEGDDTIVA